MNINQNITPISELSRLKGVKIGLINIRSLYRSLDDVSVFLNRSHFDVLCVQETFLNDIEVQCITLRLPHTRPTHILNTYRAPDGNLARAIETLSDNIVQLHNCGTPDILVMETSM